MSIGATGVATYSRVAAELVRRGMGSSMAYIPYKGAASTVNDLLGGHIDLALVGVPTVVRHQKNKSLNVYGVMSARRSPLLPEVPALPEAPSLRGMTMVETTPACLPVSSRTPPDLRALLSRALVSAMAAEDLQQEFRKTGDRRRSCRRKTCRRFSRPTTRPSPRS